MPIDSPSSSSFNKNIVTLRNPTPPRIRSRDSMGRSFPQSLPDIDYSKDTHTGLYIEDNTDFIYKQDLLRTNVAFNGINQADFVVIKEHKHKEYVRKNNYVLEEYLPENHERQIKSENLMIQTSSNEVVQETKNIYHSHSRVMMQIMLRNLLALFLKDRTDVILPKIYPIVNKDNGEMCGMISEKINFQEGQSVKSQIIRKIKETGIPSLMKILGIEDVLNGFNINNVGLTQDKKSVFFDFGRNFLDCEYIGRAGAVDLMDINHNATYLGKSLKETRERYLQNYKTENDEHGFAKTIHEDIDNIVMRTGPGDKESRKEMAYIIQTRINNAFVL